VYSARFWGWWSELMPGCQVLALAVGVFAGLLLSVLVVCESWIFSLSLLATVRGGTSFLCPKRKVRIGLEALLGGIYAKNSIGYPQFFPRHNL